MIPPQALNAVGLAMVKAAAWGIAQLATRAVDGGVDPDLLRLSRMDDRSLLAEIARRENADARARAMVERLRPTEPLNAREMALRWAEQPVVEDAGKLSRQGRSILDGVMPKARALICPHRARILAAADSPQIEIMANVAGYLTGGLSGAIVKPVAVALVRWGLPALCGEDVQPRPVSPG